MKKIQKTLCTSIFDVNGIKISIFMQISMLFVYALIFDLHFFYNFHNFAFLENKEGRSLFPRLEYTNEWTPVGRGDPLKDPTYDYMPPVLDRVRYWAEGTSHKNKNDVLLLGVPSKKVSSINKKNNYGPIKRTYFSMPYQSQFSPPIHNQQPQQQQYVSSYYFEFFFINSLNF